MGFLQLLVQYAEICRLLFEGRVRRCGNERKRLCLSLHAEGRSQLFMDSDLGQHAERIRERDFRFWDERRCHWSRLAKEYRSIKEGRLAGRRRNLRRRNQ